MGGYLAGMEAFILEAWLTSQWVRSLTTLIIFVSISQIVYGSMKFYLGRIEKLQEAKTSDMIIAKTERPISLLIIILGLKISFWHHVFDHSKTADNIFNSLMIVIGIYLFIVIIDAIIERWIHKFNKRAGRGYEDEILKLFKGLINILLIAVAFILILFSWGVTIGPFITSLGILGVALGFAMQKTLGDVMGGIALVFDRCFRINDLIELESGEIGRVVDIGLRSTKLVNLDNELVIVPNSKMAAIRITNYAKPNNIIRMKIPIDIVYGEDPKKVTETLLRSIKPNHNVLPEPEPSIVFDSLAEYSLRFFAIFYIDDYRKRFTAKTSVLKDIYKGLDKAGIGIAFPTTTVHLGNASKVSSPTKVQKKLLQKPNKPKPSARKRARKSNPPKDLQKSNPKKSNPKKSK